MLGILITNVLRKDKQKIIWCNLIIRKLSIKSLFLNNWEMPKRWIDSCYVVVFYLLNFTHHGHFNVTWVHTSPISFVACRKVSLFHLFASNKENSRHLHAGLEDVINKNCLPNLNVLNVKLMVSFCSTKFNLSTLADKLRIVFKTSKLKILLWQFCFWKIGQFALKTIYY